MLGKPAWYKKLQQQTFENNSDRFRTNLDPFTGFPVETIMKAKVKGQEKLNIERWPQKVGSFDS